MLRIAAFASKRGRIHPDRLAGEQARLDEAVLDPREDIAVRLDVDQPPRARERRVIRRGLVQREPEESADRQRVRRPPRNPAFRIDAFKVAEQQQAEVPTGLQPRSPHDRGIEAGALAFDKPIEVMRIQQRVQPRVERMARRRRQIRRGDPQQRLLGVSGAHRHKRQCSTTIDQVDP